MSAKMSIFLRNNHARISTNLCINDNINQDLIDFDRMYKLMISGESIAPPSYKGVGLIPAAGPLTVNEFLST